MNHVFSSRKLVAALLAMLLIFASSVSFAQEDVFNLLMLGIDTKNPESPGRSDTMILAQITPSTGEVRMVSFLRDLYVPIEDVGKTRLNAAYYFGGAELVQKTLEKNFGVQIDSTISVNFSLLEDLIDQIGGVDVDVEPYELAQLNATIRGFNKSYGFSVDDDVLSSAGLHHLNGKQALSYSRIRKIDNDFKRTSRQHMVLKGIMNELTKLDFLSLSKLIATNLNRVENDISLSDINRLLPMVLNVKNIEMTTAHVPFEGTYSDQTIDDMMVLVPDLTTNQKMIQEFLAGETQE